MNGLKAVRFPLGGILRAEQRGAEFFFVFSGGTNTAAHI
jgi:hypothetical protein